MTIAVLGLGTWLPATARQNDAWPPSFHERAAVSRQRTFNDIPAPIDPAAAAIVERDLRAEQSDPFLGARQRFVADPAQSAEEAETCAARVALSQAGIEPEDVDLVLSHSMVPERVGLPTAGLVAHKLGATRALGLGVENACASVLTQLDVARAYIEANRARYVLLTQSHLLWRTLPLLHPAAPGLGDAASAVVVGEGPGLCIKGTFGVTHGEHAYAVTWVRTDTEADPPWWRPGGHFRLSSKAPAQAKLLMRDTVTFGADTLRGAADRAAVDVTQLDVLACVQPRGFIPGAIAERLGLPREHAVTTYSEIAHVGACGPVFNLVEAGRRDLLIHGARVGLYAQGIGFTRAAVVLEVNSRR